MVLFLIYILKRIDLMTKKVTRNNTSQNLAIIIADIDRFKMINNTLGHSQGNVLLKEISLRIKKNKTR
jgi:diguanylate cyclase (GGDEF)-like protein